MDKDIILDNEYVTLCYYSAKKIVHHKFKKFTHGMVLQDAFNKGAEIFEKKGADKWLSDDKENPILKQEDMSWTATEWRPRVIKAGWKYWAIVLPEATAGQMAMKKIISEYADKGVTVQIFSDSNKALAWLETR